METGKKGTHKLEQESRFRAFDTETLDGYAVIIADHESWKRVNTADEIFAFLTRPQYKTSIYWTWNIDYDVTSILKYLGRDFCTELLENGFKTTMYEDYDIKYIPGLMFRIKKFDQGNRYASLYDMAKFYEYSPLEAQSQKHFGTSKVDEANWVQKCIDYQEGKITKERLLEYLDTWDFLVGVYCQDDAKKTLALAKLMGHAFEDAGYYFQNPHSQAHLAQLYIQHKYHYPQIPNWLEEKHNYAQKAYHGGIFEMRFRGLYDNKVYGYDINSAYPFTLSTLPHWHNGKFYWVDEPGDNDYGWYTCEFDCKYVPFETEHTYTMEFFTDKGTYVKKLPGHRVIYPTGERVAVITKLEYDWMKKNNYHCEFKAGFEWEQTSDSMESPFAWIGKAYKDRLEIKKKDANDMRQLAIKKMINSTYGKTAQHSKGVGKLTNFFYASYITAACRIKIADVAHQHEGRVLEIATDGIYLTEPAHELTISDSLGDWEKSEYTKALYIGSGIKQLWKTNQDYNTYARGLTNDPFWDMYAAIKEKAGQDHLLFEKTRPIHLGEVLQFHKFYEWEDLNQFKKVSKKLDVNTDIKHIWERPYTNFFDLLQNPQWGKPYNLQKHQKTLEDFKKKRGKNMKKEYEEETQRVTLSTETPFFVRVSKKGEHVHIQNREAYPLISFLILKKDLVDLLDGKSEYAFMNVIIHE